MHHARDHLQALGYSHMSVCVLQLESKNRSRHPVLGQVVNLDLLLYKILFASCGFVLILYFYSEKGGFNSSFDHLYSDAWEQHPRSHHTSFTSMQTAQKVRYCSNWQKTACSSMSLPNRLDIQRPKMIKCFSQSMSTAYEISKIIISEISFPHEQRTIVVSAQNLQTICANCKNLKPSVQTL